MKIISIKFAVIFRCILFISSLIICFDAFAQNPDDRISAEGLNVKYLEHLIKEKVDKVRTDHGLLPLYNDSILYVAARRHAEYLYKKGDLSHTEPEDAIMETPQKRAEYYGAVNYQVGENVVFTAINTPVKGKKEPVHTNETYEQTAQDLVTAWVHSPGHYKNIITPDYNATGLAIWCDPKTNRIYAVQKFAKILFKYSFNENKHFFPYSNYTPIPPVKSFEGIEAKMHSGKHAFKLKQAKKAKICERCEDNRAKFSFGKTFIEFKRRSVYLSSYSFEPIYELLKKRKDGFAAEIVSYTPYDCGNPEYYTNPTRRNGQCLFSGMVLKPVYKKKALAGFKAGTTKRKKIKEKIDKGLIKKYYLKLGDIPKDMEDYYEVNLVILQKGRVCLVKHFSSFCSDTLNKFYRLPFVPDTIKAQPSIRDEYRNISFSIPFLKGKTEYKPGDLKPLTDSLVSEKFIADTIVIKAFSSIEGDSNLNKKLQRERATHIANALSYDQAKKPVVVMEEHENWKLFEEQIAKNDILKQLRKKSHSEIKQQLEDTAFLRRIEKYLALQRSALIRLHAKEIVDSNHIDKYLERRIARQKKLIGKCGSSDKSEACIVGHLDTLDGLMQIAYAFTKSGKLKATFFEKFEVGKEKIYDSYNLRRLKFWLQLHAPSDDSAAWIKRTYEELVTLYNNGERSFFIIYNMLNLIQQHSDLLKISIDPVKQDGFTSELRNFVTTPEQDTLVQKVELNFWFSICRNTEEQQSKETKPIYDRCLKNIHAYFSTKKLSVRESNKLASFYQLHSRADWVIELLWPFYKNKKDNPEGLKMLAKVLYQNYEESHNKEYYEFLQEITAYMSKDDWCSMFVGPCNISFQAFDYEKFRDFYCSQCHDYMNYVRDPKNRMSKK